MGGGHKNGIAVVPVFEQVPKEEEVGAIRTKNSTGLFTSFRGRGTTSSILQYVREKLK